MWNKLKGQKLTTTIAIADSWKSNIYREREQSEKSIKFITKSWWRAIEKNQIEDYEFEH